ncbi:MAG: DMT family transporter [Duncaniella sp.]|nr:DMT family transporter [Duncaniella sp.]
MKRQLMKTRGYILAAVAAISYGTNPLFALPLYEAGMNAASVLFYRYMVAVILMGLFMMWRGKNIMLSLRDFPMMLGLGVLFAMSSLLLYESYNHMDVGIASTMLFVYPVMVALIMWAVYRQRLSAMTILSLAMSLGGIMLLYSPGEGTHVSLTGIIMVMLSSLSYAIYMVAVNKSRLKALSAEALTFYSMLFGTPVFLVRLDFGAQLQWVPEGWLPWACVIGIAVFPTIISLLAMAVAIHDIGSVPVAVMGALEPITGIAFGVLLFGEILTPRSITGVILILLSVTIIVLSRPLTSFIRSTVMNRLKRNWKR